MNANGLRPYPAYRDSRVEWLGKVPEHWEVSRLKNVARLVYGDSLAASSRRSGDIPVYGSNGRVGLHDMANTEGPVVIVGRKGSFGRVNFSGSPVFAIDTTFFVDGRSTSVNLRLLYHLLSWLRLDEVTKDSAIPGLDREDAYRRIIALPPLSEQRAIASFLEAAVRRIRRYIRAKERLIELLEERKRALIHEAVTGRIDVRTGQPYPAYKDSGVEWLGKVPEHWSERPLKRVAHIDNSGSYGEEPEGSECVLPVATTAQIDRHGQFSVGEMPRRGFSVKDAKRYRCEDGDILIVKSSGSIFNVVSGKAGIVDEGCPEFAFSNFLLRVVADRRVIAPRLLFAALSGWLTRERVKRMVTGSTYPNLRVGEYVSALLPIPLLREQAAIVRYLEHTDHCIRAAISATQRQIALLKEYRTRLIADVVTGKIDVREAAADLPDTDPLARNRDRAETIPTESNLHSTAQDMMKEASA